MQSDEFNAWMYHGGGVELYREAYAAQNVVPFIAAQTGPQMGGWFNREIASTDDLVGLKMRIPGLGRRGHPARRRRSGQSAGRRRCSRHYRLAQLMQPSGFGPHNDLAFGLHQAARYYYYPGWQEPSGVLELLVSADAWATLSPELQAIIETACMAEADYVFAEFNARNNQALSALVNEHGVELRRFPDDVLAALRRYSSEVMDEIAASDESIGRVLWGLSGLRRQYRAVDGPSRGARTWNYAMRSNLGDPVSNVYRLLTVSRTVARRDARAGASRDGFTAFLDTVSRRCT